MIIWKNMPQFVMMTVIAAMIVAMAVAAVFYLIDIIKNYDSKRV